MAHKVKNLNKFFDLLPRDDPAREFKDVTRDLYVLYLFSAIDEGISEAELRAYLAEGMLLDSRNISAFAAFS